MTSHDSETLAEGKQVITACAFIWADFDGVKKVFRSKRAMTKKFLPGLWELPGGHIDFGEDIVEGLKRECMEELNMRVSVGDPFAVFTYTNEIKGSHSIEVVYFAKFFDSIEDIKLNPEDHSEYRWTAESELGDGPTSDQELANIKKGFELLKGSAHNFGS